MKENHEDKAVVLVDIPKTSWRLAGVLDNDYILKEIRNFQKIIWMITMCLMVLGGFFIWILSRRLSASVKQVVNTMKEVRSGEMSAHMEMEGKNEISIIASQFNKMMRQINNQMDEIKQVSEMKKDAEIRALEAQINPHFIYNTLDSIHWLAIENGEDEISEMLSEFARILSLIHIFRSNFDLRPAGIIKMLDLRRPIYKQTAAYGHFGRNDLDLPWEKLDKVELLKSLAGI